jgi:multicomponent Na+:H+ antiporter subunit E
MNAIALIVILAIGWAAVTGSFTLLNLLFGALVGAAALFLMRRQIGTPGLLRRMPKILGLAGLFLYELMASAVRVAALVARPDMNRHVKPAIVAFPLRLTRDAHITLLANLITLTPGTLSVDVSDDRRHLFVHAISCGSREDLVRGIADGFEKRIIEAFG